MALNCLNYLSKAVAIIQDKQTTGLG